MAQYVFISGTDHGLGAALAECLADQGAMVMAGVLNPLLVNDEPEIRKNGGRIRRWQLDIASDESVARVATMVRRECASLDVLINNAAILGDISGTVFDPLDFDAMLQVYNVNTLGSLRLSQAFLPLLLAGQERLLVNISSEAGAIAACQRDRWYAYAMSKAALNMQSVLLHNLLRDQGARVLVLHPGHVRTFMQGSEDLSGTLSPQEAARLVIANIERSKTLSPERPAFLGPQGENLPW